MTYSVQPDWLPRLMGHVTGEADGCWLWHGATRRGGYGTCKAGGKLGVVSRLVYEAMVGPIPDGLHILHTCDTPACCNPEHLYPGTEKDNAHDRDARGRNGSVTHPERVPRGERHGKVRLTESQVREARAAHASGRATQAQLAVRYGVRHQTMAAIIHRKSWVWLSEEENE
jgi:hypothetical protein